MVGKDIQFSRRHFVTSLATASFSLAYANPFSIFAAAPSQKIKLGFDNFSLRALGWKAGAFIDYAASQKLDVMFFSDLDVFESFNDQYLKQLRDKAAGNGLEIYVGTYSICPTSNSFRPNPPKYSTPEELLALAIRVAKNVGSPVVRCLLGSAADRLVEGGIERQIEKTVKVLKNVRSQAMDAGVKIAIENHAGDMQAWELAGLIESAGKEFVGATLDVGNAVWTLEDPMVNLEILGPYTLATGMRDTAVWETSDGVMAQWVGMGDGNVDWEKYVKRYAELCPNVPFMLEILSEWGKPLPYLKNDFWKAFPKVRAHEFARFLSFAKKRKEPAYPYKLPAGKDKKSFDQEFQKADLERSLKYCKEHLGIGLKA